MKPTKTVTAKKKPAKRKPAVRRNSTDSITNRIYQKLMFLRNRISKKQTSEKKHIHLKWVEMHLEEVQNGVILEKGIMLRANDLWSRYA